MTDQQGPATLLPRCSLLLLRSRSDRVASRQSSPVAVQGGQERGGGQGAGRLLGKPHPEESVGVRGGHKGAELADLSFVYLLGDGNKSLTLSGSWFSHP